MNRKTLTFCLSIALGGAVALSSYPTHATDNAHVASYSTGGGQSAPGAVGGSGFSVKVATGMDKAAAESMQADLKDEGFTQAESQAVGSGYDVIIGGLSSRSQAEKIVSDLKKVGYTTALEIIGAESNAAASSSGTANGSVFRVQVASFDTASEATEASKILINEGFVNVDIVEDGAKFLLMLGTFNKQEDAQALLGDVNKAGFAMAEVAKRERVGGAASGSASKADLSKLSTSEQANTRDALAIAEKVQSGAATAAEVKQLRDMIQQMSAEQKQVIGQQETNRSAEQSNMQKVYPLYRQFERALRSDNYDEAEKMLAQVEQINPSDIFLPGKRNILEAKRSGKSPGAGILEAGRSDPEAVQQALNDARTSERTGDKATAIQKYKAVLSLDPNNSEARGKVAELESVPAAAPSKKAATDGDSKQMMIYGAAGLAALLIIVFLLKKMGGKKSAPASVPSTAGMSFNAGTDGVDPLASAGGYDTSLGGSPGTAPEGSGMAGAGMTDFSSFPMDEEEEEEAPKPPPTRPKPAPEDDLPVSLEGFGDAPVQEPVSPAEPSVPMQTIASDAIDMNEDVALPEELLTNHEPVPSSSATEPETVAPAASSSMDADLEELLKGTFAGAESQTTEASPGDEILAGVAAEAEAKAPEPELAFAQTFEDEPTGSVPPEWRGEYDYANLTVADLSESGHTKVLKFDKQEGAGSASYHLTFPNVSGRVTAEFDIRCDEKNKFLLGVYFEKDEDFKQSLHTIIHQLDANAPASLRIQGEGRPYTMGAWAHIRFIIDLNAGTVNAFMDDEQVITDLPLTVVPEYINTLSIRDNLATTGTLYLDNIKVWEG